MNKKFPPRGPFFTARFWFAIGLAIGFTVLAVIFVTALVEGASP